jgi:hypothetical protein
VAYEHLNNVKTPDIGLKKEVCPSSISSYVGGFLAPENIQRGASSFENKKQQIDQMREKVDKLDDE